MRLSESQSDGARAFARRKKLDGRASLIHVMDSEADDYALLAELVNDARRFVVRLARDRVVGECDEKVKSLAACAPIIAEREVMLSRRAAPIRKADRRRLARAERSTTLSISAQALALRRPRQRMATLPGTLEINVVYVTEVDPLCDVEPVDWVLFTTEPIKTKAQVLRIVDVYRARWLIEEYFKALKTGCDFQKRQLESWDTLLVALGLFAPVACNLLRLRALCRAAPHTSATRALTSAQLAVLQRHPDVRLAAKANLHDALLAIARLGGHLRSNGDPGWHVLGRGYQQLLMLEVGFQLAVAQGCDQS
jgi:DDE family transposase